MQRVVQNSGAEDFSVLLFFQQMFSEVYKQNAHIASRVETKG